MSTPSNRTRPRCIGAAPEMTLMTVLLPAPLGPMTAASAPRLIVKLQPSTAWSPPNEWWTASTSRMTSSADMRGLLGRQGTEIREAPPDLGQHSRGPEAQREDKQATDDHVAEGGHQVGGEKAGGEEASALVEEHDDQGTAHHGSDQVAATSDEEHGPEHEGFGSGPAVRAQRTGEADEQCAGNPGIGAAQHHGQHPDAEGIL